MSDLWAYNLAKVHQAAGVVRCRLHTNVTLVATIPLQEVDPVDPHEGLPHQRKASDVGSAVSVWVDIRSFVLPCFVRIHHNMVGSKLC